MSPETNETLHVYLAVILKGVVSETKFITAKDKDSADKIANSFLAEVLLVRYLGKCIN